MPRLPTLLRLDFEHSGGGSPYILWTASTLLFDQVLVGGETAVLALEVGVGPRVHPYVVLHAVFLKVRVGLRQCAEILDAFRRQGLHSVDDQQRLRFRGRLKASEVL